MAKRLDDFTATMIAEGELSATPTQRRAAWQHLVDTGLAWSLQGWFGRQAQAMIAAGEISATGKLGGHVARHV